MVTSPFGGLVQRLMEDPGSGKPSPQGIAFAGAVRISGVQGSVELTKFSLARAARLTGRNSCCDQDDPYFLASAGIISAILSATRRINRAILETCLNPPHESIVNAS